MRLSHLCGSHKNRARTLAVEGVGGVWASGHQDRSGTFPKQEIRSSAPFHAQADEQASKPLALGGRKVAAKPNMADALDAAVRAPHVLQRVCLER